MKCGADTKGGGSCQNPAGDDGTCHLPGHTPGRGRPDKYNDERHEKACEAARHGASIQGCGRAAGVSGESIRRWLEKYDDFRADFRRARWKGEKKRLHEDSQHARFLLARSYDYEETRRTDVTSDGEKVDAAPTMILPDNGKRRDDDGDD